MPQTEKPAPDHWVINPERRAKPLGVLEPDKHYEVLRNLEAIAKDAGVPSEHIYEAFPIAQTGEVEKDFLQRFLYLREEGCRGLMFVGDPQGFSMPEHLSRVCGLFRRNGIRARRFMIPALIEMMRSNNPPATPLLIMGEEVGQYLDAPGVKGYWPLLRSCWSGQMTEGGMIMFWVQGQNQLDKVLGPIDMDVALKCKVVEL